MSTFTQFWCHRCGNARSVSMSEGIRFGWPECCGKVMSQNEPKAKEGENEQQKITG